MGAVFKGSAGEFSERWGGAHVGFHSTELCMPSWTALDWVNWCNFLARFSWLTLCFRAWSSDRERLRPACRPATLRSRCDFDGRSAALSAGLLLSVEVIFIYLCIVYYLFTFLIPVFGAFNFWISLVFSSKCKKILLMCIHVIMYRVIMNASRSPKWNNGKYYW